MLAFFLFGIDQRQLFSFVSLNYKVYVLVLVCFRWQDRKFKYCLVSLKNINVLLRLFDFISNTSRQGSLLSSYANVNFKSGCNWFKIERIVLKLFSPLDHSIKQSSKKSFPILLDVRRLFFVKFYISLGVDYFF